MSRYTLPLIGKLYRHITSGCVYKVISIANMSADVDRRDEYPVTVIYQRVIDGSTWARTIDRWDGCFLRHLEEVCGEN